MKLTFLGANHEVTGSRTLIECGGIFGLVDYGMEQGRHIFETAVMQISPANIDFILLTHAHIDHSGFIPLLYKNGFRGKIFATDVTTQLCRIMLRDSAHIQMQEAEWQNRKGKRTVDDQLVMPTYDIYDAEDSLKLFVPCQYGKTIDVAKGVTARFTDIGHLLGSSAIEVKLSEDGQEKLVVFSGDVGNTNQPIIKDPAAVEAADYLVIESTYGDRYHDPVRPDRVAMLADCIQRAFDRGGNVIIPSFAVGRTQEMLYFLREIKEKELIKGHDGFSVYVDSPLANEATNIFNSCDVSYFDDDAAALLSRGVNPLIFSGLKHSLSVNDSKQINADGEPKVIISASGMCEAGRIRHHLKHNLWRPECLVLFVGYQALGTLGRIIHDGAPEVKLFGEKVAVRAELVTMTGVSGHADKRGLLNWLFEFKKKPDFVFVNHGEHEQAIAFTDCLNSEYGYNADAPYSGSEFDLLAGEYSYVAQGVRVKTKEGEHKYASDSPFGLMLSSAKELMDVLSMLDGIPNKELKKLRKELIAIAEKYKV